VPDTGPGPCSTVTVDEVVDRRRSVEDDQRLSRSARIRSAGVGTWASAAGEPRSSA
jgi:hypothetical protein